MSALPADEHVRLAEQLSRDRRFDEAKQHLLAALAVDSNHAGAMIGLGALLGRVGMLSDARVVLMEALERHPNEPRAHRELVVVCAALGDQDAADEHSRREYTLRPMSVIPCIGEGPPLRLLLIAAGDAINTRTARLRDPRLFETTVVAAEFLPSDVDLPPHDVVFNAIGDADRSEAALAAAERVIARSDRPVINPPSIVRRSGRVENALRLGALPGVVTARTLRVARSGADGKALAQELGLPLLLRVPGRHTGELFERIDDVTTFDAVLADLPGDEVLAMSFLDARDALGRYRKYRMMIVDGLLYPLHAAVGARWKLHFFSGTHGDAEREIDRAFLSDPAAAIGEPAMAALRAIAELLGLDYGGIDFAIDAAGRVLVFEANAMMVIPEADPDPRFAYRTVALDTVALAGMQMIVKRAVDAARRA
jgi:glutathione synthase/RimK-type ligase-like ATP-grasp enzyme